MGVVIPLEVRFCSHKIERIFKNRSEMQRRINHQWLKRLWQRLAELYAANNYEIYLKRATGKPHLLEPASDNVVAITITGNVRLLIELDIAEGKTASDCCSIVVKGVVDYHGDHETWYIP